MDKETTTEPTDVSDKRGCAGSIDAPDFRSKLSSLLNEHSKENGSNTPDFVLRDFLCSCLAAFDAATQSREVWHGRKPDPAYTRYGVELPNVQAHFRCA